MANAVVDAINRNVSDPRTRLAMLVGSWLESGWNAGAVGDGGTSFGPFQMHIGGALTSSGLSPAQAKDPDLATRAMLAEYQAGVARVSDALWKSDPGRAAALAAYYAERPAHMYDPGRVAAAWRAVQSGGGLLGKLKDLATTPFRAAGGAVAGAASDAAGAVVEDVKGFALKLTFVGLGLALVGAGAYQTFKPQLRGAVDRGAELAGLAAKGAA